MFERIVCLTEETTEALYLMGEDWRIVGISGFTVRPPRARREKPRVSAFTSARLDKIVELEPDLVLGFSDLQADIAAALVREGVEVHIFNQRSLEEIFRMVRTLGAFIGRPEKAEALADRMADNLTRVRTAAAGFEVHPKVYFEEWNDPLISGIRWVSEVVEAAGGEDCFPELARSPLARDRIVGDPDEVIRRAPDIIIGSWCGRKFKPEQVRSRPGWDEVPAVKADQLFEIKSPLILQPGPAALTDGLDAVHSIVRRWVEARRRSA